jgi:hypothetical protein
MSDVHTNAPPTESQVLLHKVDDGWLLQLRPVSGPLCFFCFVLFCFVFFCSCFFFRKFEHREPPLTEARPGELRDYDDSRSRGNSVARLSCPFSLQKTNDSAPPSKPDRVSCETMMTVDLAAALWSRPCAFPPSLPETQNQDPPLKPDRVSCKTMVTVDLATTL